MYLTNGQSVKKTNNHNIRILHNKMCLLLVDHGAGGGGGPGAEAGVVEVAEKLRSEDGQHVVNLTSS